MKADLDKLTDDEITALFQKSVQEAIDENRKKGLPVCRYDKELRKSYILYPDGHKEYAEE